MAANSSTGDPAGSRLGHLQNRSDLLRQLRQFFHQRGFWEVQTPLLADEVIPELHIEPMSLLTSARGSANMAAAADQRQWLQASPELHMKRLLADGAKAIFQVTRSFRQGEQGRLHNSEFTIVEWYRTGDDMHAGMALLDELVQRLLRLPKATRTSYAAAFQRHLGICPHTSGVRQLADAAAAAGVVPPPEFHKASRDDWLNLLLAKTVEPELGRDRPEILYDYPASQAALAKTLYQQNGLEFAERFELYVRGIELANGYHELTDAQELRHRLRTVNAAREKDGRQALPLPDSLLAAMERGLPECAGVALGFDRLVMLAVDGSSIADVMAHGF